MRDIKVGFAIYLLLTIHVNQFLMITIKISFYNSYSLKELELQKNIKDMLKTLQP